MAGRLATQCATAAALVLAALGIALAPAQSQPIAPGEHWTWGADAETDSVHALRTAIEAAIARNDYAALDALELKERSEAGRGPSGVSMLPNFYSITAWEFGPRASGTGTYSYDFLLKWQAASPRSAAPIITRALMLDDQAWCHRGSGTADTVAPDAWPLFHRTIEDAAALLKQNAAVASADPHYYVLLEDLAIAQGTRPADFHALLEQASDRFPYYYEIYYTAFHYYRPQWYGSREDMDAVARFAVERTRERDGTSAYFRVYWERARCHCFEDLAGLDQPTMQTAMADLARAYPANWTYMHLAHFACLVGDGRLAQTYFTKLAINNPEAWTRADWDQCRSLVGPSSQPFPDAATPGS